MSPTTLPTKNDPCWRDAAMGLRGHDWQSLPLRMLMQKIQSQARNENSPRQIDKAAGDIHAFFERNRIAARADLDLLTGATATRLHDASGFYSVEETAALIRAGKVLLVAGDEDLLSQLPKGKWIGGTTANFMSPDGGVTETRRIFATDVTEHASSIEIRSYGEEDLHRIAQDYPDTGFSVIIIPGLSPVLQNFACHAPQYDGVFNAPLYGWIAGVDVTDIGERTPKTFAGDGAAMDNRACVMHVTLPAGKVAALEIVNLFEQGDSAEIEFHEDGLEGAGDCLIDGKPGNLVKYFTQHDLDMRLPLVADYHGAMINVSLRDVDPVEGKISFYAPVFKGMKYRFAAPIHDYVAQLNRKMASIGASDVVLSCNCILNYLYGALEGKKTGAIIGPITFGEIGYLLLNQTLVLLKIDDAR